MRIKALHRRAGGVLPYSRDGEADMCHHAWSKAHSLPVCEGLFFILVRVSNERILMFPKRNIVPWVHFRGSSYGVRPKIAGFVNNCFTILILLINLYC